MFSQTNSARGDGGQGVLQCGVGSRHVLVPYHNQTEAFMAQVDGGGIGLVDCWFRKASSASKVQRL